MFILKRGLDDTYLLLYVDGSILTCSSDDLWTCIIDLLSYEFAMKDLGPLFYFLGIFVSRTKDSMFLCQRKYVTEILPRAVMTTCKSTATPVDTKSKVSATSGSIMMIPLCFRLLCVSW